MCKRLLFFSLLSVAAASAHAAGRLVVEQAWIRVAPPGAMMLAGYATLRNEGDASVALTTVDSVDFGSVSLHQTVTDNDVERMRPLDRLVIAPGARAEFLPGGKHFMLMRPTRELKSGDKVKIHIATDAGDGAIAEFVVRDEAPAAH
jgi:periplasmic copper chaperone A